MGREASLADAVVQDLSARLADAPRLRLPGCLTQQGIEKIDREARLEYLSALLSKDPGVFLERHGHMLSASELGEFDQIDDYEALEPEITGRLSALIKNRRLAQLNRLIEEGSYFEDGAMRSRAPLLHHQYVGQYRVEERSAASIAAGALPADRGGHPLSDSVIAGFEEAQTQQRLKQQQAAEDEVELESSEEDDWPEDRRAELQSDLAGGSGDQPCARAFHQAPTTPTVQSAAHSRAASPPTAADGSSQQSVVDISVNKFSNDIAVVAQAAAASLKDPEGPRGEARTAALLLAHAAPVTSESESNTSEEPQQTRTPISTYVHIPIDEQAQLQADFLSLMHQRFLSGEEEDVDYRVIDADQTLDDDLASQVGQDAEDAYFDAE